MKLIFLADFQEILKYQIHENPYSRRRVVPRGQSEGRTDRQTWRSQESIFGSFANAPENGIGFLKRMSLLACVSFLHPLRHAPT